MIPEILRMKRQGILPLIAMLLARSLNPYVVAQVPAPETHFEESALDETASQPAGVLVSYEAYSLPIAKANELQRKGSNDDPFYKEVVRAGKIERLLMVRSKSGQRAVLGITNEMKCPAEFHLGDHPVPQAIEVKEKDRKSVAAASVSLIPMSYERREAGDTLEIEPTLSKGGAVVDVTMTVSHVAFTKKEKWGKATVEFEQPQFETQKLNASFAAPVGKPCLVGTLNPPFGNGLATRTEQNVWFCFLTITVSNGAHSAGHSPARK